MSFVSAYIIYDGTSGTYVGNQNKTIQINCDRLRAYSPRPVWLLRRLMPGDGTQIQHLLTFEPSSAEIGDSNTLQGFAIEVDGQDTMIDISSADAMINLCDCPDCVDPITNVVPRFYTLGITSFVAPTLNTLCVTRSDDGSGYAHDKMVMDYTGRYIGIVRLKSNVSGVSVYELHSFYTVTTLIPVLADVISSC